MEKGVLISQALQAIAMQSESEEQKIKTLKIQPLVRVHRWSDDTMVPEIRLSGAWLQKLGFCYGEKVEVRMSAGILVITPLVDNCS
ncbi:MAG TPA: SymE family type I addiction module toxin [Chitinophagaceae bacterium]|nr:SymE family type I addiction module toxin [Chitinophagaceae bacterium]